MRSEPLMLFHLKLVAKIALAAGMTAVLCLMVALSFLAGSPGESYHSIIRNSAITGESLGPLMLLASLTLVSLVGVLTWLITLYSSFRIAGPLYRFSQNFKLLIKNHSAKLIELRTGDSLRNQEQHVTQAITGLRDHYAAIEHASNQAGAALERGDATAYAAAIILIRELDEKARI